MNLSVSDRKKERKKEMNLLKSFGRENHHLELLFSILKLKSLWQLPNRTVNIKQPKLTQETSVASIANVAPYFIEKMSCISLS